MTRLTLAFLPLTDAAALIAAARLGFAAAEGVEVDLVRESSWANVRDKLVLGLVDGAHMLAPLALATHLGAGGQLQRALIAPARLNLNGNAVTASVELEARLRAEGFAGDVDSLAQALGRVARARRATPGAEPLTLATVFPVSTHTYLLRALAAKAGLDPERDLRLVALPPAHTVDALRGGLIDAFCAGSPWNSVAVESGFGAILCLGRDIIARAPEKVLALGADLGAREPAAVSALVRAIAKAGAWAARGENHAELAALLAAPEHLGLPAALIQRTLDGRLITRSDGARREAADFLVLGGPEVTRPDPADAAWCLSRMVEAGHIAASLASGAASGALYRPDLHDAALAGGA